MRGKCPPSIREVVNVRCFPFTDQVTRVPLPVVSLSLAGSLCSLQLAFNHKT